jgi:hypothetical protein
MSNFALQLSLANPAICLIAEDEPWLGLSEEEKNLLLRDWFLERRQLQMDNQRLTKHLDAAHKRIRILQQGSDGDATVTSQAVTVRAGSSVKKLEQSSSSHIKPQSAWKKLERSSSGHIKPQSARKTPLKRFASFFQPAEQKAMTCATPHAVDTASCVAVCDDPHRKCILEVPPCVASKYLFGEDMDSSCRKGILEVPTSVASKYLLGGDVDSCDATDEGSLGSSSEHRLAEF